jgi:SAM-dependent methyltransferase
MAGVSQDAVLLLGPLYHLPERDDRLRALAEARRVARPGGVIVVAGITRFGTWLEGLVNDRWNDSSFREMVERDLRTGRHEALDGQWFTTAYFHRPDELASECVEAGLEGG